jgi:molecular chaperone DnaJ
MATDFYKILGVDEKAKTDEIKKKYRQLAKKYHPDQNKDDKSAEEKFKQISEAYDVLKDARKRQQYDTMRRFGGFNGRAGHPGAGGFPGGGRFYTNDDFSKIFGGQFSMDDLSGFGGLGDIFSSLFGDNVRRSRRRSRFQQRRSGPQKGNDIKGKIQITLQQSIQGVTRKIKTAIPEFCTTCSGQGTVAGSGRTVCTRCNGTGQITNVQGGFSISRPCPSCLGQGATPGKTCTDCRGSGILKKRKTIEAKIPAGIENGGIVRLSGLGYPGTNGGPKGDLFIEVLVMSDQKFKREGNNIHSSVDVTFPQAALGGKVQVKSLTGKVMMAIKPGTQPGTVMRLKGMGLAVGETDTKGDLFVTVNLKVPTELTDRQKELLQEFDQAGVSTV